MNTWRLLIDKPASGAWNMAVDESLLEHTARKESLPTLRLYDWTPACLSLGHAQKLSDVDMQRLQSNGWEVVRRATGGRAILHTDELTYSITAPQDHPLVEGSVLESYLRIAQGLLAAVNGLSLPVEMKDKEKSLPNKSDNPVCFEVPSAYEITVNGKKLIGSAQSRKKEGVLQHGSLPLYGDLTRITQALVFKSEEDRIRAGERLLDHATTVETVLGVRVPFETAAQAFIRGFETIGLSFEKGEMSAVEKIRAEELFREKYNHESWMNRV